MWDNRANKKNPRQPDFKCKDKENCDGVIWPPRGKAAAAAQPPATTGNLSASGQVKPADDRSNRIERQHSQHMFLLVCQIKGSVPATTEEVRAGIDWWQRDISRIPLSKIEQQAKTMFNATEVPAEGEKENEIPF
jgi:hypothetical protein